MRDWRRVTVGIVCAATLATFTGAPASAQTGDPGARIPRRFLVRVAPGEAIDGVLVTHNASLITTVAQTPWHVIESDGLLDDDEQELELMDDGRLEFVEPDRVHGTAEGTTQSFFPGSTALQYADQPATSQIALSSARAFSSGLGVVVAVLDTGVSAHASFADRLRADGFNFIDQNSDTSDSPNGLDDNGNNLVDEKAGHGTLVAGLIALVAPDAQILPVKVLNSDGSGSTSSVAAGIRYAMDHGADVINLSLICPFESELVNEAIEDAIHAGVVVVAGMPNNGARSEVWPASRDGVLSVTAVDASDHLAPFSDRNRYVKLCAPGVDIHSTMPNDEFGQGDGTSFATAWVSGAAALVRARTTFPASGPVARQLLLDSAVPIDHLNPTFAGQIGRRLDILAAVTATCRADLDDGTGLGTPDGGVTVDDLLYFLHAFEQGVGAADVDDGTGTGTPDGGVTIDDLLYFLARFEYGC